MKHPPDAQMRRAGSGKPTPKRKSIIDSTGNIHDDVATLQASRVASLYVVSFEVAATIAQLAWGLAR
ncbi:hypothetical protein [Bradyrhizobium sp. 6(2017)]|uniref:hypothetical protein n=1 Tax=Bradyrhizobium sp. 6(2017) TaxID=1197460 RepID=UPI0013E1936F|nr:hypothetical protein [Bradyrhizobium sp. 6(2017)]QIG91972.1 hypothetical protein G6P99_05285 [Bradyrhizobium sp. 6(2017)]